MRLLSIRLIVSIVGITLVSLVLVLRGNPSRKKPYEAPKITLLKLDRAKAQLAARALTGDRDAEVLLEAS